MHKIFAVLLSLILVGEGLTLKTNAATSTSHSATSCNYCKGGGFKLCTRKATISKATGKDETGQSLWLYCDFCGNTAKYWVKLSCSSCHFFTTTYSAHNTSGYQYTYTICSSTDCYNQAKEYLSEEDSDGAVTHRYADRDGNWFYLECSHGLTTGPHNYTCSSHSSYGTTKHYYCTTHGYVGTSSTCPGLAVTPTPANMSLYYGQKQQITPNQQPTTATVTYTSANATIASVSSTGSVTGKKKGSTTITVTATL